MIYCNKPTKGAQQCTPKAQELAALMTSRSTFPPVNLPNFRPVTGGLKRPVSKNIIIPVRIRRRVERVGTLANPEPAPGHDMQVPSESVLVRARIKVPGTRHAVSKHRESRDVSRLMAMDVACLLYTRSAEEMPADFRLDMTASPNKTCALAYLSRASLCWYCTCYYAHLHLWHNPGSCSLP